MCIAIYRPKGAPLTKSTLLTCWKNNSDGAGFMYSDKGKLVVDKGYFKFKLFWRAIRRHLHEEDKALVVHFRISTSGKTDYDNCHPHLIHDGLAYVHNGIISSLNDDKDKSDTARLAEYLSNLPSGFIKNRGILALIQLAIGFGNKLVFMDNEGNVSIVNKNLGTEDGQIWYSNETYKDEWPPISSRFGRSRYEYFHDSEGTLRGVRADDGYDYDDYLKEGEGDAADHQLGPYDYNYCALSPLGIAFKDGYRRLDDLYIDHDETGVDDQGRTIADYEALARAESQFWIQHAEYLEDDAVPELLAIIRDKDGGSIIRDLQEWLDVYQPDLNKIRSKGFRWTPETPKKND